MSTHQQRAFNGIAAVCEVVLDMLTSETARTIASRLNNLANGAVIPESGFRCDTSALAALLNRSPAGVRRMAERNNVPSTMPGDSHFWNPIDFVSGEDFTT